MTDNIVLWDYYRSSASYRVRIALNLAGLTYEKRSIDLLAGEQKSSEHRDRNPQGFVPVLDIDGMRLTQSLAMLDYLDETRGLGLNPGNAKQRAKLRAAAMAIAIDVHPIATHLLLITSLAGKTLHELNGCSISSGRDCLLMKP